MNNIITDEILKQIRILDLSNKNIEDMPNSLVKFKSLIKLDISYNKIKKLCNLPKNLKILIIRHNEIQYLPKLPDSLIYLDISYNNIKQLPYVLPKNLKILLCSYNELKSIFCHDHKNLLRIDCYANDCHLLYHLPYSLIVFNKRKLRSITYDKEENENDSFCVGMC
jgi:invasion plasmid antigen